MIAFQVASCQAVLEAHRTQVHAVAGLARSSPALLLFALDPTDPTAATLLRSLSDRSRHVASARAGDLELVAVTPAVALELLKDAEDVLVELACRAEGMARRFAICVAAGGFLVVDLDLWRPAAPRAAS